MPEIRTISIIVPCYNEEAVLAEFYRRAAAVADGLAPARVEFLFVDDCSRDATAALLAGLASRDERVKVLRLARNCGHQLAVTAGLDYADGDAVVIIDADLQDPPETIPAMIDLVRKGFDVVHAQRLSRKGEGVFKLATARLFYAGLARLSRTRIIENCGDFRAFSAPAAEAARYFREPHRFLRGLFAQIGFRQCVFQYERHERFAGSTKYTFRKMAKLASDALFSFSSTPVRAILWMAAGLWGLSLLYLAYNVYLKIMGQTVPGWTSLIFLLTVFTGLILASIAVVGAYVGRIFEQGQGRPMYWLAEMRNVGERPLRSGFESREMKLSGAISQLKRSGRGSGANETAVIAEVKMPVFSDGAAAPVTEPVA
jgi:glycosyltransferase involved in cell wall biosynthesis